MNDELLLQQLKEQQREYLKKYDIENLNIINKQIYNIREKQRQIKEEEKIKNREIRFSKKADYLCEKSRNL